VIRAATRVCLLLLLLVPAYFAFSVIVYNLRT